MYLDNLVAIFSVDLSMFVESSERPGFKIWPGWGQNTFTGTGAGSWPGIIGQDCHILVILGLGLGKSLPRHWEFMAPGIPILVIYWQNQLQLNFDWNMYVSQATKDA